MTISTWFQSEIDLVDDTKTLVFTTDAVNYAENEWSYNGLEITGHDDYALSSGASELLYQMGFRHYGSSDKFVKRPASIPTNLTQTKTSYYMPYNSAFLAYGVDSRFDTKVQLGLDWNRYLHINNLHDDRLPGGHRWGNIITNNLSYFNANTDMIIGGVPSIAAKFNLSVGEPQYSNLVMFCAAYMLSAGLNAENRTNFDPTDGDQQSSNLVWAFSKAVVDQMRAGTDAIGGIAAQDAVPDAELGLYVYGGHRFPPDIEDLSGLYAQVALGFNNTSLSYLELVQQFGAKVEFVLLREYWDTMAWSNGMPQRNSRCKRGYFSTYDDFQAAGALGVRAECQLNWLANMVGFYTGIRVMRTGVDAATTHDAIITSLTDDIFDGDPAVHALYTLWGSANVILNKYSVKMWVDLVNDMEDSWYKTLFEKYMVICYEYLNLPNNNETETFPAAFESLMSKVHAITADDIFHSYAFERRLANGNVSSTYPTLWMYNNPLPTWTTDPVAPTHADFVAVHTALQTEASRPDYLTSEDLVLIEVESTTANPTVNPEEEIFFNNTGTLCFVGPGTFHFRSHPDNITTSTDYGPGKHLISSIIGYGYAYASNGGKVFVYAFPTYGAPDGFGKTLYVYIPEEVVGDVKIVNGSRCTLNQGLTTNYLNWQRIEITSSDGLTPEQQAILTGGQKQFYYGVGSTSRSTTEFGNVNPWLSPYRHYALLPRELVELDFPARVKIKVPAFAGTDDSVDPLIDETTEEIDG